MIPRKLVRQLESLKSIKPRTEWKDRTRDILLAQISAQSTEKQHKALAFGLTTAFARGALITAYRRTLEQLFARPLALSGVLSIAVVAAVSVVVASENSMPGDPLYTVKRTQENVRVAFVSPQERPVLQLDLAEKRFNELSQLSARPVSGDLSEEKKQKQAFQLSAEADKNIETAQKDLLRLTKETPEKAVRVASEIKEWATLQQEQSKEALVPEVFARLDETKNTALSVIVEEKEAAQVSDQEVASHLEGAISELEARLARLQSVHAAGFREEEEDGETAQKVRDALDGARDSLVRNEFSIALSGINTSHKLIVEGEQSLTEGGDAATDGLR
ncbi:MAG: DUF5667 domain-containing protein, partial [Patescibacteria group bacterium]